MTRKRIAITGGTGFVGGHLARSLAAQGHSVVLISRTRVGIADTDRLAAAFRGCDAVAHCAGINRELGSQTFEHVHVEGTRNVVDAARRAGVGKIVLVSFLRARPDCGSGYHESKWAAEQIVRESGLDYTILKPGVIYGRGDHMLDHLSHAFHTFPVFGLVGLSERPVRPLAVEDVVRVLAAALVGGRMSGRNLPG
jgi:NADH dehydrogenase